MKLCSETVRGFELTNVPSAILHLDVLAQLAVENLLLLPLQANTKGLLGYLYVKISGSCAFRHWDRNVDLA